MQGDTHDGADTNVGALDITDDVVEGPLDGNDIGQDSTNALESKRYASASAALRICEAYGSVFSQVKPAMAASAAVSVRPK